MSNSLESFLEAVAYSNQLVDELMRNRFRKQMAEEYGSWEAYIEHLLEPTIATPLEAAMIRRTIGIEEDTDD